MSDQGAIALPSLITADWYKLGADSQGYRSVTEIAPALIGCTLVRRLPTGEICRGLIVETEAYGNDDPACHAFRGQTASNSAMFGEPGLIYGYFIYGMYHCLNVVTEAVGIGSAVLIRAIQLSHLPHPSLSGTLDPHSARTFNRIAAGPGKLCRTLAIDRSFSGQPFAPQNHLWLEHRSISFEQALKTGQQQLTQTTRIGISKAMDYPWRWYLTGNPAISKP